MDKDIGRFSISEAHNDSNGKSSNSKMNGTIIIWTGCLSFILASIGVLVKVPEAGSIATVAAGVILTGAGLSGYSKKKGIEAKDL